jgi:hypothetical protein
MDYDSDSESDDEFTHMQAAMTGVQIGTKLGILGAVAVIITGAASAPLSTPTVALFKMGMVFS